MKVRTGRPTVPGVPGEIQTLGIRVTSDLKNAMLRAAEVSGRSLSQECQCRLERSIEADRDDRIAEMLALILSKLDR